jgi:hypothetical protein
MRKYLYLLLLAVSITNISKANPGDTTFVQATNTQLTHYGNFDTLIAFPSSSLPITYRRIYMTVTIGKYMCPGNPQYCGDWDYTVDNYLMTKTGDTVELGRLITPYADAAAPRTTWTWTQPYVFDVTDFYPLLKDSATIRLAYSGYSWGFTANTQFAFIEGIPDRNVTGITRLWNGYFGYGGAANTINNNFPVSYDTAPANTKSANIKFIVTGHGSDANGCCEFMPHFYKVFEDSNQTDSITAWRTDCGSNELYPQSGTWLYQRSNWCPGALVYSNYHILPNVVANTIYNCQILFDSTYTSNGGGGYACDATLIYYDSINKNLDATLEDVIAPTNNENHFRENPLCGLPTIQVKNTGATIINSISFQYGIKDSVPQTYTWNGTLAPLGDTVITLPELYMLDSLSQANSPDTFTFVAQILKVNGVADDDPTNDTFYAPFKVAPTWPNIFSISMRTNNEGVSGVNNGISVAQWQLFDMNNNVITSRTNLAVSTSYLDTIRLTNQGCYKFVVSISSCDGLEWWAHAQDGSGINDGFLTVRKTTVPSAMTFNGDPTGTYANDFGCGFVQYFTTNAAPLAIENINTIATGMEVYPNPAQNVVNVSIGGLPDVKGTIELIDALGRVVFTEPCNAAANTIHLSDFANGMYTVLFVGNAATDIKLQKRIIIAK